MFLVLSDIVIKIILTYVIGNEIKALTNPKFDIESLKKTLCYLKTVNGLLFLPMFIVPYFLRSFRLRAIFHQHKRYLYKHMKEGFVNFRKIDSSYCLREANLALWFILIIGTCLIVIAANLTTGFMH